MSVPSTAFEFKPLDTQTSPLQLPLPLSLSPQKKTLPNQTVFPSKLTTILPTEKGQPKPLTDYTGKVLLIVNTASKCGFTPQYATLEQLYKSISTKYPGKFEVLGFPCNQFGGQEPGSADEISEFCMLNYGVTFPIFGKTNVNGDDAEPLFEWLKKQKPGLMGLKRVKWNFEKFLVGKDGKVVDRWASTKNPLDLEADIVKAIEKN
ncbi:glutathione peroxidase family protein [Peziza echinospora]|nr:glutathione peroxidase family protein [Peziza echinospora]